MIINKNFRKWIEEISKERSPIVLALDYIFEDKTILLRKSIDTIRVTAPYICGIKINHHLTLPLGIYPKVKEIIETAHRFGLPTIMDCKINDIGNTNREIARQYYAAGFDAVIANPFVGWDEGIQPIFEVAKADEKGVILLGYMSHRGAYEGFGQRIIDSKTGEEKLQYMVFAEKALAWNADGIIVGATYPEKIREINGILKNKIPIYSPGVGTQGGNAKLALNAGATFLIIGRSIISARDPEATARKFREIIKINYY